MSLRTVSLLLLASLAACEQSETPPAVTAPPAVATPTSPSTPTTPPAFVRKPAPAGAVAYIISPDDGAVVSSPVTVVFGLKGIGVVPAGIERPDAGHHHLLIDAGLPPLDRPIPADAQHVHFGQGQTETQLMLAPGRHTLQLLLGDHLHVPHEPPIASAQITIEVQ